jgi:hypothetical protein
VASFAGDGAYDRDDVHAEVAARHPEAAAVVPPRANAVPSDAAETVPTRRDAHLRCIAERGRMARQRASGYGRRALVEADISRWKRVTGDGLRFQTDGRQATEVAIAADALNRSSTSDARSTSASHDPEHGSGSVRPHRGPCNKAHQRPHQRHSASRPAMGMTRRVVRMHPPSKTSPSCLSRPLIT